MPEAAIDTICGVCEKSDCKILGKAKSGMMTEEIAFCCVCFVAKAHPKSFVSDNKLWGQEVIYYERCHDAYFSARTQKSVQFKNDAGGPWRTRKGMLNSMPAWKVGVIMVEPITVTEDKVS